MIAKSFRSGNLRADVRGGVNAAVLSLPVALAFGVLSGAGPIAGVYGAVCVGLFSALFGGTPGQISGPTGPTALVMVTVFITFNGDPAKVFTVVMIAGVFQILFGAFRLGRYIHLMPYPVISGWATGIGTVIIIMQLAPILGFPLEMHPIHEIQRLPAQLAAVNVDSLLLAVLAIGVSVLVPTRFRVLVPPYLLALAVGTLVAEIFFEDVPRLAGIYSMLPELRYPVFDYDSLESMLFFGISIALLGSIDSLLASMTVETAINKNHNSEHELLGQGVGNLVAGVLGAIPGAGTSVRTMTNIRAGGRTAWSGVTCSLVLLATVPLLGLWVATIPAAVLAGILVVIAVNIIDWRYLKRVKTAPRSGVIMMFTVMALTIVFNLIFAVAVGFVLASALFVKRMADLQLESVKTIGNPTGETSLSAEEAAAMEQAIGKVMLIRFAGPISFGAASRLQRRLSAFLDYDVIILDLTDVPSVDSSATMALETVILGARARQHTCILVGLTAPVARVFARLGLLGLIREMERYPTRLEALRYSVKLVKPRPGREH